jgi:hypothetical protein
MGENPRCKRLSYLPLKFSPEFPNRARFARQFSRLGRSGEFAAIEKPSKIARFGQKTPAN